MTLLVVVVVWLVGNCLKRCCMRILRRYDGRAAALSLGGMEDTACPITRFSRSLIRYLSSC